MKNQLAPALSAKIRYLDRVDKFLSNAMRAFSDDRRAAIERKDEYVRRRGGVMREMNLAPGEHELLQRSYMDFEGDLQHHDRNASTRSLPPRWADRTIITANQLKELRLLENGIAECDKTIAAMDARMGEMQPFRDASGRFLERVRREFVISPIVDLSTLSELDMERSRNVVSWS